MPPSLDLSAHAAEISSTHKRILSGDPSTAWAVFGFDRGGTALNVQAQGNGPLDELSEEFSDGQVQFAFVRVQDPNTQLPKFVLISWCGQGVPVFRKGMVSSQVGEVQQVLSGAHVTVLARTLEDVEESEILDKVGRSSGAQYSYHTQPRKQPPAPAAKPAFAAGSQPFRKGATYGAPSVVKSPAWSAAASQTGPTPTPKPTVPAYNKPATTTSVPSYAPPSAAAKPSVMSKPTIGGSKPLFGGAGASGAGRPVSSFFGAARSPTTPVAQPSPPASPAREPERTFAPPAPSYRSQQEERQAELEALRRGSRGTSPTGNSRSSTPAQTPSRFSGASTPATEPSSQLSQADQTRSELEMLRNRRMLNSDLGASSSGQSAAAAEVSERKSELEALRRARGGSQSSYSQPAAAPVPAWKQNQAQKDDYQEQQRKRQQQEEEEERRRRQQQQEEEEERRRRQQQQEEEEAQRRRKQQQEDEERRRLQQQEDDDRRRQQQQREEEERRRRQKEQQEEEERQRLQQLQKEAETLKQMVPASGPSISSRGPRARAVYDYEAEAEDELAFKDGEIIYNVEQLDPGWWAGESEDGTRQGVFPANFVEMIEDEDLGENHATALYDYEAAEDGELTFAEGEKITHIDFPSSEWWEGVNQKGEYGLFPANYVELDK
ncbi:actin binding protein [Coemansia sp. Benny D115]|nr:actin binding protein [Coemansia sp. Benny D115]